MIDVAVLRDNPYPLPDWHIFCIKDTAFTREHPRWAYQLFVATTPDAGSV